MKQAATEVLHDIHVSVWLSDHYELTLGKEGAGICDHATSTATRGFRDRRA
jgi:hypothetical protein